MTNHHKPCISDSLRLFEPLEHITTDSTLLGAYLEPDPHTIRDLGVVTSCTLLRCLSTINKHLSLFVGKRDVVIRL
jgi:hypothetical protein